MPSLSEETNGRIERLMPGATIGIIGGGQLGRMMALSARYMASASACSTRHPTVRPLRSRISK